MINPALFEKKPFDAIKDFTPISLIASSPLILVSRLGLPASATCSELQWHWRSVETGQAEHRRGRRGQAPTIWREMLTPEGRHRHRQRADRKQRRAGSRGRWWAAKPTCCSATRLTACSRCWRPGSSRGAWREQPAAAGGVPSQPRSRLPISVPGCRLQGAVVRPPRPRQHAPDMVRSAGAGAPRARRGGAGHAQALAGRAGLVPVGNSAAQFTQFLQAEIARWAKVVARHATRVASVDRRGTADS